MKRPSKPLVIFIFSIEVAYMVIKFFRMLRKLKERKL